MSRPWSARICDGVTIGFATWTVACHVTVAAGGSLRDLLYATALLGAGAIAFRLWRGRTVGREEPGSRVPVEPPGGGSRGRIRWLAVAAAVATLLLYSQTREILHLWWGSVGALALAAVAAWRGGAPALAEPAAAGSRLEALLWASAAVCLAIYTFAFRFDLDTPFYVGLAASAAALPDRPLMLDPIHGIPGLGLHQPAHRVHTIEILAGAVSYLTGLSAFASLQFVIGSIAALLVPLAAARLFRILTPRYWMAAVVCLLVVLLAVGRSNWYGNFSVVRLLHGKAVYMSVFLPLAYAYGLRFGIEPRLRRWILLCAVQVAAVGCSSTAIWSVPIAAGLGAASGVVPSRRSLRTLALAALASAYVVGVGLSLRGDLSHLAQSLSGAHEAGSLLAGALAKTLGTGRLELVAWASVLLAWSVQRRGAAERFAIVVPLVVLLLVLNPYFGDEIQRFVTGPAYRRAFWALPVPILMTLAFSSPLRIEGGRLHGWERWLLFALITSTFAVWAPIKSGLGAENRVSFRAPQLKADQRLYPTAAAVGALAPAGSRVLAPQHVALWLLSVPDHPPVVYARESYLQRIGVVFGPSDAEMRMRLSEAVSFPQMDIERRIRTSDAFARRQAAGMNGEVFLAGLRRYDVRAVAMNRRAALRGPIAGVLAAAGFEQRERNERYEIWIRDAPW